MNWQQMRRSHLLAVSVAVAMCQVSRSQPSEYVLRYNKPAQQWSRDALPLGSGRLGCMVFRGVGHERIQFNEESLWIGDENDMGAYQAFAEVAGILDRAISTGAIGGDEVTLAMLQRMVPKRLGGILTDRNADAD